MIDIACGDALSVALTRSGSVFQWGDLGNGQRTNARLKSSRLQPRRVLFPRPPKGTSKSQITAVFAGGYSGFALDSAGHLWVWGPNNYGQCGIESDDPGMTSYSCCN